MSAVPRVLMQTSLALPLLFATLISLIRLQPHDSLPMRSLITPTEGCPAPCWQGIRPNVTSASQAIAILVAHPWVTDMAVYGQSSTRLETGAISWDWNGAQPFPAGISEGGVITVTDHIVRSVTLETDARFGDLWLLLDQPEEGAFAFVGLVLTMPEYLVEYQGSDLTVTTRVTCGDFWTGNTTVTLYPAGSARQEAFDLSHAREASCKPSRIFFSS